MTYSVGVINAAIYCRLSKDDGTDEESCSIQNQKSTLIEYVQRQGSKRSYFAAKYEL